MEHPLNHWSSPAPQDFGTPEVLEDYTAVVQPTTSHTLCASCHTAGPNQHCGSCKTNHYCSIDCQRKDWGMHHVVCKALVKFKAVMIPSTISHRRVLLFTTREPYPVFTHINYPSDPAFDPATQIARYFRATPSEDLKTISFHNRYLPYWIQLWYDGNPNSKRLLESNQCIGKPFRGPVMALAFDPETGLSKPPLDVDTTILGPVLEYANLRRMYHGPVFVEQPQHLFTENEWIAMKQHALEGADSDKLEKALTGPGA